MADKIRPGKSQREDDCGCEGATLSAGELGTSYWPSPYVPSGIPVGKDDDFTRGQDVKKCPTDPITLHRNYTRNELDVTGELRVDAKSCPVRLAWNDDPPDGDVFPPGFNERITVPVGARKRLVGFCTDGKHHLCKWSWTPTNP